MLFFCVEDVPLLAVLAREDRMEAGGLFRVGRLCRELLWSQDWIRSDRFRLFELREKKPQEWSSLPLPNRAVPLKDIEISQVQQEFLKPATLISADVDAFDSATKHETKLLAWVEQVKARQRAAQARKNYHLTTRDVIREPLLEQDNLNASRKMPCNCARTDL